MSVTPSNSASTALFVGAGRPAHRLASGRPLSFPARVAGVLICALAGINIVAGTRVAAEPLRLEAKVPLGAIAGRIDHLAIDLERQRLFVAELGNNSLGIVDLKSRTARTIGGFDEPQGVLYLPALDRFYVTDGGDGVLRILQGSELSAVQSIKLGDDADNIRLDPASGQVVVGHGGGSLAFIDPATGSKQTEIALPGHPESFQFSRDGKRVFVNVPEAHEVAVAERSSGKVQAHWRQTDGANFAMAIDAAGEQAIVAFRASPSLLGFVDLASGELRQRIVTCDDVDDLFVDARRPQIYVICGAGEIEVFAAAQGNRSPIGRVPTAPGARTGLFVPELNELFVAVPARAGQAAAIWIYAAAPR